MKSLLVIVILGLCSGAEVFGKEKVKLHDVSTLTLHQGRWTTSRRTQPVPQLQCVGGSAGCSSSQIPSTVQCYNRGSDGQDVQWECKADLQDGTQFGALDVLCEGYDYPDDPYILKGSCGLEYKLESRGSSSSYSYPNEARTKAKPNDGFSLSNLIFFAIIAVFIYALYKTCLSNEQRSPTAGDGPGHPGYPSQGYQAPGYPSAPPPPSYSYPDGDGCSGSSRNNYYSGGTRGGSGAGNFWTGAATGGILGYLFGNRGSQRSGYSGYEQPRSSSYSNYGSSGTSSSTHSASGFGGTRRR